MVTYQQRRFLGVQVGWILLSVVLLALIGVLSLQSMFVLSLIGLLVASELTAPYAVVVPWRVRLRRVVVLGIVAFGLVVVRRVLEIVSGI